MTTSVPAERQVRRTELLAAGQVVSHVRSLIEAVKFCPGQRLPAEREVAKRDGLRALR